MSASKYTSKDSLAAATRVSSKSPLYPEEVEKVYQQRIKEEVAQRKRLLSSFIGSEAPIKVMIGRDAKIAFREVYKNCPTTEIAELQIYQMSTHQVYATFTSNKMLLIAIQLHPNGSTKINIPHI